MPDEDPELDPPDEDAFGSRPPDEEPCPPVDEPPCPPLDEWFGSRGPLEAPELDTPEDAPLDEPLDEPLPDEALFEWSSPPEDDLPPEDAPPLDAPPDEVLFG